MAKGLLFGASSGVRAQLVRSVLASNAGFTADFCLLAALVELVGLPYLWASAASFAAGSSLVYLLNAAWVFQGRRFADRRLEYAIFLGMSAAGLGLNLVLLAALTEGLGLHYLVSKVASAVTVFLVNFAWRKFLLFPTPAPARTGS